ncbi:hypothetical protein PTSG_03032 [Salpingoeca rosetta]|uniref:Ras GTPase-activating protein n=1 Tax=Salpingoeca rosetta (strain ATCC 50818 / BSB-021) TaxID=946362 RepID=F2U421_SALR5|nr:uncharacterized protein PTSG_03032 [Salpingoeca rosetta]EGD82365.1 hypothetical protein PTSG_03032 [Salpingoeca rosetta]|eukprot:XP_004996548.1 hypothetical protein PTSG_03032 [Salpingoeca rosetta]
MQRLSPTSPLQTDPPARTVSFSTELLNGFSTACQIGDDGARLIKDMAAFFKKRQEIETTYAKSLNKLATQYLGQVPEDKRKLFDRSQQYTNTSSSILTSWYNVLEEALFTAGSHEQLASNLGQRVTDPLASTSKDIELARKQHIADGLKQQKHLQDAYTELKKAQSQHSTQQKEVDDCQDALERAKGNYMTKDSTFQKLNGRLRTSEDKAALAAQTLHEQEDKCTKIQLEHYKMHFPRVLEEMEQREEERAAAMKAAMLAAVRCTRDMLQREVGLEVALCSFIQDADTRLDIEQAIRQFDGGDDMDAPVTSILNPTLKSHLAATALESPKPFRDYLFILVAHNRRLYQYESDNAQHPKFVATLPLGNRTVRPVDTSLFGRRHVFQVITKSRTLYIECPDQKTYRQWMEALREVCFPDPNTDATMRLVRSVSVTVVEAKDLPKSGDYFALVLLDHERQAMTSIQSNTNAPYWNQSFTIDAIPIQAREVVVEVHRCSGNFGAVARQSAAVFKRKVANIGRTDTPRKPRALDADAKTKERVREGDVVGRVVFTIADQSDPSVAKEHWAPLASADGDAGSIRVAVQTTDECIRPEREYQYLRNLIHERNQDLQSILRSLDLSIQGSDRIPMAQVLMSVAHANDSLPAVLLALCQAEVQGSTNPTTLFRGNSLATKAIDEFMKIITIHEGRYLQQALAMPIQTIYDTRASCELDPTRITASDVTKERNSNYKRLLNLINLVWSSIDHSITSVPAELRFVFHHLHRMVAERFPDSGTAPRTAVVGFFFLRLICPAIMGPQLFGLQVNHPEDNTARTLILISKVIQNMANGITFGQKEDYMKDLNAFIGENAQAMEQCLLHLTSPPPSPIMLDIDLQPSPRCLAAFHRLLEANLPGLEQTAASEELGDSDRSHVKALIHVVKALRRPSREEHDLALHNEIERQERLLSTGESVDLQLSVSGPGTPLQQQQQQEEFIRTTKKGGLSTLLRRTRARSSADPLANQARVRSITSSPTMTRSAKTSASSASQAQQQYRGTSPSSMEVELALSDSMQGAAFSDMTAASLKRSSPQEPIPEFLAEQAPEAASARTSVLVEEGAAVSPQEASPGSAAKMGATGADMSAAEGAQGQAKPAWRQASLIARLTQEDEGEDDDEDDEDPNETDL